MSAGRQDSLIRLRHRILARIMRSYEIAQEPLRVGPVTLDFVRIADPDRVLDQVAEEEDRRERAAGRRLSGDELHLPYWAQLWDSALGVAGYLAGARGGGGDLSRDRRVAMSAASADESARPCVLDLGCGMGLAGAVAAALGASVLFADIEPPALLFAALNSLPWRDRVRTRRVNWRTDRLSEQFDLIIGADVLYERQQWEHLDGFWKAHLRPEGSVLLGEPGRQTGDAFPDWIRSRRWGLERSEQSVSSRPHAIRIFRLRRLE